MESIIFFIVAMGINLIIKSAGDKKKIEEARRKRAEQLRSKQVSQDVNQMVDKTKDEKAKWNREAEVKQKRIEAFNLSQHKGTRKEENSMQVFQPNSQIDRFDYDKSEIKETNVDISIKNKDKIGREKLVNAIIWSEILSEPKSVQNIKRRV